MVLLLEFIWLHCDWKCSPRVLCSPVSQLTVWMFKSESVAASVPRILISEPHLSFTHECQLKACLKWDSTFFNLHKKVRIQIVKTTIRPQSSSLLHGASHTPAEGMPAAPCTLTGSIHCPASPSFPWTLSFFLRHSEFSASFYLALKYEMYHFNYNS